MRFWNLATRATPDGNEELDLQVYGVIGGGWFDDGVDAGQFARDLAEHPKATKITVHINSVGGIAFDGIAIYNQLRRHPAKVVSIIEGQAASAASIIAMAGTVRMLRGSMMMIHSPASGTLGAGQSADHRRTADILDKLNSGLVEIYQAKTGKTAEEIAQLLADETYFDAAEALAAGFADEIDETPVGAEDRGTTFMLNAVPFPREMVPGAILAMATPQSPEIEQLTVLTRETLEDRAPELLAALLAEGRLAERADQAAAPQATITRELLASQAPALLSALLAEGGAQARADATIAERNRLQAIENMAHLGHRELTARAKYGAEGVEPLSPEAYAMAVLAAERKRKAAYREDAAADAADSFVPSATPPDRGTADAAYRNHLIKVGAEASSAGRRQK